MRRAEARRNEARAQRKAENRTDSERVRAVLSGQPTAEQLAVVRSRVWPQRQEAARRLRQMEKRTCR